MAPLSSQTVRTAAENRLETDMIGEFLRVAADADGSVEVPFRPRDLELTWAAVASLAGNPSTDVGLAVEAGRLEVELARQLRDPDPSPVDVEPSAILLMALAHFSVAGSDDRLRDHRRRGGRLLRTVRERDRDSVRREGK